MQQQIDLFSGVDLRDVGINNALNHANTVYENWQEKAYHFLLNYTKKNNEFMAEDVRLASNGVIPDPPSNRAWGGIFVKAAKAGLISRKGFRNVKNAKAHCTPATLWQVN